MAELENSLIAHTPAYIEGAIMQQEMMHFTQMNLAQRKTLVLDLDETLVHASFQRPEQYDFELQLEFNNHPIKVYIQKRPGVDEFLNSVVYQFDVFIFTASMMEYAFPVVRQLLPTIPESHILTRNHCKLMNGMIVKDLSIFRRSMGSIIIVDNNALSFQLQPENGIPISTWVGDYEDNALLDVLLPFLNYCRDANDVREVIEGINTE